MPFSIYGFADSKLAVLLLLLVLPHIQMVAYRVGDLQHRSRGGGLVTTHDILEHDIARRLLFCSEDGSADYGGVLVVGEVLGDCLSNVRMELIVLFMGIPCRQNQP